MLEVLSIMPSPDLQPVIERFFITRGEVPAGQVWRHSALPSIMQSIVINFRGTIPAISDNDRQPHIVGGDLILGQHTRRFTTTMKGKLDFTGVHFSPTGLYRLIKKPMQVFADTIRPLEAHINSYAALREALNSVEGDERRVKVLETFIAEQLLPMSSTIEAVDAAAQSIRAANGAAALGKVAREAGLSQRSMQRYFAGYIGVSPKAFARVARFNSVTRLMESGPSLNWQNILLEAGYFDKAHFARDFKAISGQTPTEYYKGKTDYERFFYGT